MNTLIAKRFDQVKGMLPGFEIFHRDISGFHQDIIPVFLLTGGNRVKSGKTR